MEGGRNFGTYLPARRGGSPAGETKDSVTKQPLSYLFQQNAQQVTCKT